MNAAKSPAKRDFPPGRQQIRKDNLMDQLSALDALETKAASKRHSKKIIAIAFTGVVVFGGAGVAAATGLFGHQAHEAFSSPAAESHGRNDVPGDPTAIKPTSTEGKVAVATSTPDGSPAQLWVTPGTNDGSCTALLYGETPGSLSDDKQYDPALQAACDSSSIDGQRGQLWISPHNGSRYMATYGAVPGAQKVEFHLYDGTVLPAAVDNGYFVAFIPYDMNEHGWTMNVLGADGHVLNTSTSPDTSKLSG